MSAAMAMPLNPLAGTASAFSAFRRNTAQANGAVRRLKEVVQRAAGGLARLGTGARTASTSVRTFAQNASGGAQSLGKLGRSTAHRGVKTLGTRAGRARSAIGKVGTGIGGILAILAPMLPVADIVTGLMSTFGTVMTVAAVAMTAVNVAMRANPIGFLVGLIVPIAAYLIEFAMNSETGQRIMKQIFQQALKAVQAIWRFIGPFVKTIGTAVGTYFKGYLALITGVIKVVGSAIGGISKIGSAVSSASNALRGIASRTIGGIKNAVRPILTFVTDKIPGFFRTAKNAVSGALRGIGDLVKGALSAVVGVVKGPINGLIAFANWIIDGLNKLSVNILGKKFGVDIDKIPMLAEGGVVFPGATDAPRIDPLTVLENRRVPALTEPPRPPHRIRDFHEEPGAGPRSAAEDLLFLASAHA
ncbi:phage tail protein [Streptomyces vilmorinianum]|uniref:phage tail protein n=1 Tax=Streptomyces vilmorinianum TaxID=3051092 RepID=UPI0010FB5692|nr:tape-measure protein [Streptomyces vilmorinianum]